MATWPYAVRTTYVNGTTPEIDGDDLNALQEQVVVLSYAPFLFGDGSDGDATLDGVATVSWATKTGSIYSLQRDVFLDDITINAGVTLRGNSYRIFVAGTLTNDGAIENNGRDATAWNVPGGNAWDGGTIGGGTAGGNGGDGITPAGVSSTLLDASLGGRGGRGGTGDSTGSLVNGAVGGSVTAPIGATLPMALPTMLTSFAFCWYGTIGSTPNAQLKVIMGGSGGGGGHYGNDGIANASKGGSGGGGGGVLQISARRLVNNGVISANGGTGLAPTLEAGAGFAAGGGGGGGGGTVILLYGLKEGAGTITATGGTGGAGFGGGSAGNNGADGNVYQMQAVA